MEPVPVTTVSAAGQAAAVQASLPQHKEAVTLSTSTQKVEKQRTKVVTHSLGLLPLCKAASRGDPQAAQGEAHLTRKELRPANNHEALEVKRQLSPHQRKYVWHAPVVSSALV